MMVTKDRQLATESRRAAYQSRMTAVMLGPERIKPAKLELAEHYAAMMKVKRRETEVPNITTS